MRFQPIAAVWAKSVPVALVGAVLAYSTTAKAAFFANVSVDGSGGAVAQAQNDFAPFNVALGPFSDSFTGVNMALSEGNTQTVFAQASNSFSNSGQVLSVGVSGFTDASDSYLGSYLLRGSSYNSSISGSFTVGLTGQYEFTLYAQEEPTSTENADSTNQEQVTLVSGGSPIVLSSDTGATFMLLAGTQVSFSASISGFIGSILGNPQEGVNGFETIEITAIPEPGTAFVLAVAGGLARRRRLSPG